MTTRTPLHPIVDVVAAGLQFHAAETSETPRWSQPEEDTTQAEEGLGQRLREALAEEA